MLESDDFYTVTDLKQFEFCARVVFYERCLPHLRPRTYKMDAGRDAHEEEQKRSARRNLSKFGFKAGKRMFDIAVKSEALALRGHVDELILVDGEIALPIDYKLAQKVGEHHRLQVAAYAIMIEETLSCFVPEAYIYLIPKKELIKVPITSELRLKVKTRLQELQLMIISERMPEPAKEISRCAACEFRRFCNDTGL